MEQTIQTTEAKPTEETKTGSIETSGSTDRLDRWLNALEKQITYYVENPDQLYRPYVALSLIGHSISLIFELTSLSQASSSLVHLPAKELAWLFTGVCYHLVMMILSLALRSRLRKKAATAVTLFASHLLLQLLGFNIFSCVFGLFAGLNSQFRASFKNNAPKWYLDLCEIWSDDVNV